MKSVLFVCLGNICRSPMAEGILRARAEEAGMNLFVDSAGTGDWHTGEAPDQRATLTARKRGIDISKQKARQIRPDDFLEFDLILCADAEVFRTVSRMATGDGARVELIMNMCNPGSDQSVPDPYYGGKEGFDQVFDMLDRACLAIVQPKTANRTT